MFFKNIKLIFQYYNYFFNILNIFPKFDRDFIF